MGYYCTVPQCTSLAGKTKNVKFHRFPRDTTMADKWNNILKRGKPYTKYSKVCSLHFTQGDYNVTTMGKNKGQWKTLSKDAVPTQNLPKLNPDGSLVVIRKSRTIKFKDSKNCDVNGEKLEKWHHYNSTLNLYGTSVEATSRLLGATDDQQPTTPLKIPPSPQDMQDQEMSPVKPEKQDAFIQTDPYQDEDDLKQNTSFSETASTSDTSYNSEHPDYTQPTNQYKNDEQENQERDFEQKFDTPKDYTKNDYLPQTNEEYNKEAEKYALERKSLSSYEKLLSDSSYQKQIMAQSYQKLSEYQKLPDSYQKPSDTFPKLTDSYPKLPENYQKVPENYQKIPESYQKLDENYQKLPENYQKMPENYHKMPETYFDDKFQNRSDYLYQNSFMDPIEILRNQQHNLQMLQQQRLNENQNFFNENHIKQEIDITQEEDKFMYDGSKEPVNDTNSLYNDDQRSIQQQRLLDQLQSQVKQEPDGCDSVMQTQPRYYPQNETDSVTGYYEQARPGPEILIAKQNALAAHTQLWQNTMKRPFFYSENPHFNTPPVLHRYEDITRILQ